MTAPLSVVVLGATGAVGSEVVRSAVASAGVARVTTLGRRPVELPGVTTDKLAQHTVDVFDPASYEALLKGHDAAVCTLGVGQPSKASPAEYQRVEMHAPTRFAEACRRQGVGHFTLMTSVGADPTSRFDYLRWKGELEAAITALGFARVSLFRPSMLLTPTNRYGLSQAVTLAVWPHLDLLLSGPLKPYRGIRVADLGRAMVANALRPSTGPVEVLTWADAQRVLADFR